jgi:hypothetical protein
MGQEPFDFTLIQQQVNEISGIKGYIYIYTYIYAQDGVRNDTRFKV